MHVLGRKDIYVDMGTVVQKQRLQSEGPVVEYVLVTCNSVKACLTLQQIFALILKKNFALITLLQLHANQIGKGPSMWFLLSETKNNGFT
jgi:hypothetical protein